MHVNFFYWEAIPFNELVIILSYPPSDSEVKTMHPLAKGASGWEAQDTLHGSRWWVAMGEGHLATGELKIQNFWEIQKFWEV